VRGILESLPGVDEVLDPEQQARYGIDHPRSGEFVVVAEPGAWFTYYYWLDDDRAPEFARGVDIHRKPGYDPAELFFDPSDPLVKLRAAGNLLKKTVGMRYAMNLVPLDAGVVRGTHGRLPDSAADTPIVIVSDAGLVPADTSSIHAVDVHRIILAAQGIENASADLAER
jgi:predicted AlkP superfamily pyrophosphatase or phosphodiesterase